MGGHVGASGSATGDSATGDSVVAGPAGASVGSLRGAPVGDPSVTGAFTGELVSASTGDRTGAFVGGWTGDTVGSRVGAIGQTDVGGSPKSLWAMGQNKIEVCCEQTRIQDEQTREKM